MTHGLLMRCTRTSMSVMPSHDGTQTIGWAIRFKKLVGSSQQGEQIYFEMYPRTYT